jgi:hypothetical protein
MATLPWWMRTLIVAVSLLLAAVTGWAVFGAAAGSGGWRWPLAALGLVAVAAGLPLVLALLVVLARPGRRS